MINQRQTTKKARANNPKKKKVDSAFKKLERKDTIEEYENDKEVEKLTNINSDIESEDLEEEDNNVILLNFDQVNSESK